MRLVATLLLSIAMAACGGGDPTIPGGGGNGITNFTAKVDGVDWNAEFPVTAINGAAGLYSISALRVSGSNAYTLIFTLYNITGPGTYPLGVGAFNFGGTALISQVGTDGWSTPLSGVAGQIVITTLSATQMVGTFSFVATPLLGGAGASKTVTQGVFDIPVSGTFGVVSATGNQGSSLTGNIGGTFVAASALVSLNGATPQLTITAENLVRNVSIGVANMTGPGTYTLSATTPVRTILVGDGVGAVWTSATTGGSGSVIVTSVTATRIMGTFTATVIGVAGGASGSLSISGTFNLGRL